MLFKLTKTYICPAFLAFFLISFMSAQAASVAKRPVACTSSSDNKELTLADIVRQTMAIYFGEKVLSGKTLDQFASELNVGNRFRKPSGVFVTLSYKGKTRACWGSIYPSQSSIARQTVYTTIDALTKEYRYPLIKKCEWRKLKPQITVITGIEPIGSIAFQNPLRDGLLVRSAGKAGVYLPGEAADAHYQLVHCKLKAGIKSGEPYQMYRLRTEIYE